MLLHYIGKVNSSNLLQILKKMQKKKLYLRSFVANIHPLFSSERILKIG